MLLEWREEDGKHKIYAYYGTQDTGAYMYEKAPEYWYFACDELCEQQVGHWSLEDAQKVAMQIYIEYIEDTIEYYSGIMRQALRWRESKLQMQPKV